MSYKKTCDEVEILSLRDLYDESKEWLELMRNEEPAAFLKAVARDLNAVGKTVDKLDRRSIQSGVEYDEAKELLVGFCVKHRVRYGDRTPSAVRS